MGRAAGSAVQFPNTHWSAILHLKDGHDTLTRERALRHICHTYWFPLYAFARKRGVSSHDAEDAVQNFFYGTGNASFFEKADQGRGKLRTFILTAFTRMLMDQNHRARALKRGGSLPHFSLDTAQAEGWLDQGPAAAREDPVLSFERHWALTIMRTAIEVLRAEAATSPKAAARFSILCRFLNPDTGTSYTPGQAAEDLGMSISSVSRAIHRLRQHFRLAVRELVAGTLENPDDSSITEELIQLQEILLAR